MQKAVSDAKSEGVIIDYQIVQGTVATSVTSKAYVVDNIQGVAGENNYALAA